MHNSCVNATCIQNWFFKFVLCINEPKYIEDENSFINIHELGQNIKLKKTIFPYNKNKVQHYLQTSIKIKKKREQQYETIKTATSNM